MPLIRKFGYCTAAADNPPAPTWYWTPNWTFSWAKPVLTLGCVSVILFKRIGYVDGPKPLASRIPLAESSVVGSVWDKDTGAPVHGLEPWLYVLPGTRLGLRELTSLNVIVPYEFTGLMVVICA